MGLVGIELRDDVALVTLEDPGRRNALSLALAGDLVETFRGLEGSPDLRAVVITGAPPAFSAGADLDDLARANRESLGRIYEGFLCVARCAVPTIAAVNGPAVGAGLNLALCCDVRVAAESARFESRFIDLALHPGGGHTWMLERLLGPQGAAALVLCGESLDGAAAARRGLAWTVVPDDALLDEALRLARRATVAPPALIRRLKATLRSMAGVATHDDAVRHEIEAQLWSVEQPEFHERIAAMMRRIAERGKTR
jgi:enoyl-CoA hydratase